MASELAVTLPPESTSAGLARRCVRDVCAQAGLDDLVDDALLLVTELVTNAVVHAGTSLELRVAVRQEGLRIEVSDEQPGGLPQVAAEVEESREGGRGLFLLQSLATEWGTTHRRNGKSLWFSLGSPDPARRRAPAPLPAGALPLQLSDVGWLLEVGERTSELGTDRVVRELLHRLVDGLPLPGAALVLAGLDGVWEPADAVGVAPLHLTPDRVRRAVSGTLRSAEAEGCLVLALGTAGRPFGALLLGQAQGLDAGHQALARLVADKIGVLLEQERAREAGLRDRGALTLLAEASEMFAGALDVTLATMLLCQLVVPRFGTWAAVFGAPDGGAPLLAASHVDEGEIGELRGRLASAGSRRAVSEISDASAASLELQPRLVTSGELPHGILPAGSEALLVPLTARRRVLGLLLLARTAGSGDGATLDVLIELSRRAALAVEGARLYEERSAVAQALQSFLLPPALPVVAGVQFGARYAAAGEGNEVGGDFYDVFPAGEGRWAVAIGDVCGKGPEAATITGLARSVLRLMIEEGRAPQDALRRLNTALLDLGDRGRFLTAALAVLEPHDSGVRLVLATAGHPPPVIVGPDGSVRPVGVGGTLLGVTGEVDIAVEEVELGAGEQLVLYTDGVTERRNGSRWFGDGHLQAALGETAGRPPDVVAGHLERRVRAFAPTAASDDLAVLVVAAAVLRQPVPTEDGDRLRVPT